MVRKPSIISQISANLCRHPDTVVRNGNFTDGQIHQVRERLFRDLHAVVSGIFGFVRYPEIHFMAVQDLLPQDLRSQALVVEGPDS